MIQVLAGIGGGAFVLACLLVGGRLVLLAARTRELPELLIGFGLFSMGGLGYPLLTVARLANPLGEETRIALGCLALFLMWSGETAVCVFNWRVFRPGEAWARALTAGVAAFLAACLFVQAATPGLRAAALGNQGIPLRVFMFAQGVPLVWGALESWRSFGAMRRRETIGLGDPVVSDRLRLWTIAIACAFTINLVSSISAMVGIDFASSAFGALVTAPLGLVTAAAMARAFLPSRAYLERVRAVGAARLAQAQGAF
jgi:hypothetical protein